MREGPLVAIAAPDGGISLLNPNYEATTGFALVELRGRPLWTQLPVSEHAEAMHDGFLRTIAGESVEDQQGNWLTKDGAHLAVQWSYAGVQRLNSSMQAVVIAGSDMRVNRQLQSELADALDRNQAILDTSMDGILTIDENAMIQSFNHAAERIFGYRATEVIGRNASMLVPHPRRAEYDGHFLNYLTNQRHKIFNSCCKADGLRRDGTLFPMELSMGDVQISGRHLFIGIIHDIADRSQLQLQLQQCLDELAQFERSKPTSDFVTGLAQEVSQPLSAILGYSQASVRMVKAGTTDMEQLGQTMEQIARQGTRAAEMIHRLCTYFEQAAKTTGS